MSGRPFFLFKCVRNVIEKAVSICVIILQDRKVKKFNFTISKFRAQRYEDIWPTKVGKPWRVKSGAHADMVPEGFGNFIAKDDRPANSHDVNPPRDHLDYLWRDNIQRSSPKNTERAKTVTMLRLREKCAFRQALGAHTFYTSHL